MPVETREAHRIDGIDLLRGLAILFVILNHVNMRLRLNRVPFTEGLPDDLVTMVVWNGQRAVQMFFAISGFLITSTSLRRWASPGRIPLVDFYKLRFARIAPLMLALLAVLTALHLAEVKSFVVPAKTGGLGRALLAALTFHVNVLEATRGYLPGSWDILWSLSVEEVFYLGFPLAARMCGHRGALAALLGVFVFLGPLARTAWSEGNEVWREYSYLGGMDAIALGCLAALALDRFVIRRNWLAPMTALGGTALVFSFCGSRLAREWGLQGTGLDMTLVALGTCLVSAAAAVSGWKAPGPLAPLLRFGRNSYEIYLTHMFVVFGFLGVFLWLQKPVELVPAYFAAAIIGSGLLGGWVARLYSEPANRMLRRTLIGAGTPGSES